MVVPLGPGKFYGSSLPRPRFYTDVKLNTDRVDPPPPVLDPLMSWAEEAHWSMGGLNFKRRRLQGRIEGNVERLRAQRDQISVKSHKRRGSAGDSPPKRSGKDDGAARVSKTPSPPPPPVALKRRRVVGLVDEDDEDEDAPPAKRGPVRKLGDDFERVARESGIGAAAVAVAARTRSKKVEAVAGAEEGKLKKKRKLVKGGGKIGAALVTAASGIRNSPRLAKSGVSA
ncbi:K-box region and MADS-box transcription factor family protein [Striga asiatica]|uniref:K-box region and MADS-box transcription factor family protein n=1 Tax=Striga asiatica TaxID=4170 RepID=A0A5A7QH37_STRAF|nr:K-box region and MADS-box transcription factor family protein [Striga asiatica]